MGGGGSFGGAETPGSSTTPSPGAMVGAQAPDSGSDHGQGGGAAAASAGAGAGGGGAAGGQSSPMGGGMGMGGMGHGGGGGGQGGDTTRQSKWKTTGSIFDDQDPAANFSGIVGRDPAAEKPKTPKR